MKKAPPVRLSLRKLFIAMLAVGPISILPGPVLAAVPSGTPFTVLSGGTNVTWSGGGTNIGTLNSSVDRAVVSWHPGNFTINAGDTFNFNLPNNVSVILNKVGYGTNGTTVGATDNAVINGNLFSNGRVIVLANGSINVGAGAQINTQGLVLSTLLEPDHFTFTSSGNLALTGAPANSGNSAITVGGAGSAVSVAGSLGAYSGSVALDNVTVLGDLIVNQKSTSQALSLAGNNGVTSVGGNLTASTANTAITQGSSSLTVGNQTSLMTNGAAAVTLANTQNSFNTVTANVGSLTIADSSSIIIGNSTISAGPLTVTAANDISTGGTVAVTGNVNLSSTVSGNINFAHNSTVSGTLNASVASGNISLNTAGSLTLGTISGPTGATTGTGSLTSITISSAGTGYTGTPTVTITGGGGTGATATAIVNTTTGVVTGVTITNAGTGYTSNPTIALAGGTGSPTSVATATAVLIAPVASATVSTGGTGFTGTPTVTFTGGGGTGLVATAVIDTNNVVTGITITNGGTGFTSAPTITVTGGGSTVDATATTVLTATGGVGAVSVTGGGTGYVSVPTVTLTGGGGTGAAATATITGGAVTGVATNLSGSGFTSPITVGFGGGGGTPASLAPVLSLLGGSASGAVISINTLGTALISGPITGTSITVQGSSINATSTGSVSTGSSGGPAVFTSTAGSIVLPTATASRFEVTSTGGSISQFGSSILTTTGTGSNSVFNAGTTGSISLTSANVLTNAVVQLTGSTASINNTSNLSIGATNLSGNLNVNTTQSAPGAGSVNFGADSGSAAQDINIGGSVSISTNHSNITEGNGTTSNVFGSMTLSTIPSGVAGSVALLVGSGGTGYTAAPSVTISGGGGTGASATALFNTSGQVSGFTITSPGTGYTASPTVTFGAVAGASGATATTLIGGNISFLAAEVAQGGGGRYGQFIVPAARDIVLTENTPLNTGTLSGRAVTLNGISSDILINGTLNSLTTVSGNANSGSIIEGASGAIISGGAATFRTSNSFGANLSSSANSFGGSVRFINGRDNIVVASSNITLASNTSVTAANSSVTVQTVGGANNTIRTNGNVQRLIANSSGNIIVEGGTHNTLMNLTANDASATSITQTAAIGEMNGVMTLKSAGNIVLNNVGNNLTGSVVLDNTVGDASVYSSRNLTIRGSAGGNLTAVAGASSTNSFGNPWGIILGNLNVKSLNAIASNGGSVIGGLATGAAGPVTVTSGGTGFTSAPSVTIVGGGSGATATAVVNTTTGQVTGVTINTPGSNFFTAPTIVFGTGGGGSGAAATVSASPFAGPNTNAGSSGSIVQQDGTRAHVENTLNLVTINGGVLLDNNGNNFGRVQSSSGGATGLVGTGNITIVEDPTMKVGLIATSGNVSLTSRFGSVIEDSVENVMITANGTGKTLTLAAPNGSVQLGGLNRTSGTTTGNVTGANITASGAAQLLTSGNLTIGAMSANSLAITANNIDQSGPLNIFGLSSFTATNNITLTNTSNNFGPLSLTSLTSNGTIAVNESSTLNLRTVSMTGGGNGTFSANSGNGDIIDTGLGGVRLGGGIVSNTTIAGQGVVSLSAANGNVILDDPTSDVLTSGGIAFNAQNVTISVLGSLGSTLVLGAAATPSTVSGNLTASSALGNIGNAGPLTVGGTASFQTPNGNITIAQPGVGFGALRFIGNQINIAEGGNMDILTGSSAFGPAALTSGGSISIVDAGGGQTVIFGNNVAMNATTTGNITLKLVQAVGNLSVTANGTKDLSALSIATDLNNKVPIFGGAGANIDPKP